MYKNSEIWLTIEEVCSLTNEIKETVRRKCKSGKYESTSVMQGHNRVYSILLSSLPQKAQDVYLQLYSNEDDEIERITKNSEEYAKAPLWARKQADKYLQLMSQTKYMTYKETVEYLKRLKETNSDLAVSYVALFKAKRNYENFGIAGILSKKGQNREHTMPMDKIYLDYFKSLYLKEGGPSASYCWRATLGLHTPKENSLISNLGISVHFALPYNAQTKPVERDFLKVKEFLSKGCVGYRGGKVTERPEKLKKEVKENKILEFSEFKTIFDDFIENVLNKTPSKGKALKGRCPDEAWAEEFAVKKIISKDALKLFCMRTSKPVKIGRNGIKDSQLGVEYWDEWMSAEKGRKVFIRRDVNAYQEAWVFDAKTEKYLGKGNIFLETSFLAKTNIEKTQLQQVMAAKKKEKKSMRSYVEALQSITEQEKFERTKLTLKQDYSSNPNVLEISNTKMDQVIRKENKIDKKEIIASLKPKRKLYLTAAEKRRDLARMEKLEEVV